MKFSFRALRLGAFYTAAVGAIAGPAWSQTGPASSNTVETVIVTAQKREENVQNVPISVTALSADALAAYGATGTADLTSAVPGLVINHNLTSGIPYIRGIGENTAGPGVESPVAVYFDGVYVASLPSILTSLNDIAGIEVLKGPQGTLFGRNSTGGVVQINTRTPSATPTADVDLGAADHETFSGHLYVSGGVAPGLATSFAAYGSNQGRGYGYNTSLQRDAIKSSDYGFQNKWLWDVGPDTKVAVNLLYSAKNGDEGSTYGIYPGSLAEDHKTRFISPYTVADGSSTGNSDRQGIESIKVSHDLGFATLSNLIATQQLNDRFTLDQNGLPFGTRQSTIAPFHNWDGLFTDELQLSSNGEGPLKWIGGLFYLSEQTKDHFNILKDTTLIVQEQTRVTTESYAAFVQGTESITPDTRITLGLRYTVDRKTLDGIARNGAGVITNTAQLAAAAGNFPLEKTWRQPTYRASIDHDFTPDVMGYLSYNRGFRSGQYNTSNLANPPASPETVDAYEAGLKTELFDRQLRLNLSTFFYDYKNVQLRTLIPPSVLFINYNAAAAKIAGLDADFEAKPMKGLTLRGGFDWLPEAKYTSFPKGSCPVPSPTGGNSSTIVCNLSGNRMIRSPKFTGGLAVQYDIDLSDGATLQLRANDAYNSGFAWDPDGRLTQSAYHDVGAEVRWNSAKDNWYVAVWGKNLSNAVIYDNATAGTSDIYVPGIPRTYGFTIGRHW